MAKKVGLTIGALVAVVVVLGGIKGLQISAMIAQGESFVPPPESVTTAKVKKDQWRPFYKAVGTVQAVQGVMISAEAPGIVRSISFESGQQVKRGTVLVRLDTATEKAQLASATARAELGRTTLSRAQKLRAAQANTAAEVDSADAEEKQAAADTKRIRASIAQKTVRAPFDGRLGIRQVNLGEFLNSGTPIVSLQSLDPIYVDFSVPQQRLASLGVGDAVRVHMDASHDHRVLEGTLETIDTEVDVATRNIRIRAEFKNPEGHLRPGMFVDVRVLSPQKKPVLAIPATAVLYAPYGDSIYVVEEAEGQKVAKQRFVRLGETRGDFVAVRSGVKAGEEVVTSGAFKLQNNMPVKVDNKLAPDAKLSPKPKDT